MSNIETTLYSHEMIEQAAEQLLAGNLIAFPTETVFGLGAVATDELAVQQVFRVKGRPADNPLIVHVANIAQVEQYVSHISDIEYLLMQHFWPGPLTIVFPKKEHLLAPSVTPNQSTVAIRMPNHPEALALIEAAGIPLVGPSANTSGKPSPTRSEHVYHDLSGKIAGILQPANPILAVGVESTVVIVKDKTVNILRPGMVTKEMIESLGLHVQEIRPEKQLTEQNLLSPGVKYTHYSPQQPVTVLINDDPTTFTQLIDEKKQRVGVLADDKVIEKLRQNESIVATYSYGAADDLLSATQSLYAGLRALEQSDCQWILAQGFVENSQSHALMNRLTKAADKVVR